MYQSRLEKLEVNFSKHLYRTEMARLFDNNGQEIESMEVIPSSRWDPVQQDTLLGELYADLKFRAEKQGLIVDDLGLKAVADVYRKLSIDEKWSVQMNRGFIWWGAGLAQRVSVGRAIDVEGIIIYKLQARTEFLKDFKASSMNFTKLGQIQRMASTWGIVSNPEDPTKLELVSTLWLPKQV